MRRGLLAAVCAAVLGFLGCGGGSDGVPVREARFDAEVRWTKYGLVHVNAKNYAGLGYGYGYAVARDHLCLLSDRVITLRGDRSGLFGSQGESLVAFLAASNIDSDLFYRVQLSDEEVAAATRKLSYDARSLAEGYAAGFNRRVRDMAPDARHAACKGMALPTMKGSDVVRATMQVNSLWKALTVAPFASASLWEDLSGPSPSPVRPVAAPKQRMASNAWAYGSDATGTGASIMVANPHTQWQNHWLLMHQMHLTIPGEIDVMGADFLGLPVPLAGFTRDLAWSIEAPSTVTYPLLLALDVRTAPQPSYVIDGEIRKIAYKTVELELKQPDGSIQRKSFRMPHADRLGALYRLPQQPGRAQGWYAITDPSAANANALDQIIAVAKARNIGEFEQAVARHRGITAHLIAGDRHGQTMFIESGPLLDINDTALRNCAAEPLPVGVPVPAALDGKRGACTVRDADGNALLARSHKIPALATRGIIHNANDSYGLAVLGRTTVGYSALLGEPLAEPNPRTRMSQRLIGEALADGHVSVSEATDLVFSNRNYAAETVLDDLIIACGGAPGCNILAAWDRRNNGDSRGVLFFNELWPRLLAIDDLYAQPYDPTQPYRVRTLSQSPAIAAKIKAAAADTVVALEALGLRGDEAWGTILARNTNKERVPLHGGSDAQGVLNALDGGPLGTKGYADITGGTSYMHVVTWVQDRLVARIMLAGGQSTDPASPHFSDQVALFAQKRLISPPFTAAEIAGDPELVFLALSE